MPIFTSASATFTLCRITLKPPKRIFRTAVELDPQDATAQYQLGYLLYEDGEDEAAFRHLLTAAQLNSDLIEAQVLVGGAGPGT